MEANTMFTYILAAKLFEGFSVLRWNDRLRPIEFNEMDRHALKAAAAFIIGKEIESESGIKLNWANIIEPIIFDILRKIATADIKSTVSARIKNDPEIYEELKKYILDIYKDPNLGLDDDFISKMRHYLSSDTSQNHPNSTEAKILRFAHNYSTKREFDIIAQFDTGTDLTQISHEINNRLETDADLTGATGLIYNSGNNYDLFCRIERLRYQIRWGQTPRVPATNVLGHSMYVAILAYFLDTKLTPSPTVATNNFFAALFHDLPESFTRDIISPVKRSSTKLDDYIKNIEKEMCAEFILKKVNPKWRNDMENLLTNHEEIIVVCDKLAAFMEAHMSQLYGITSKHLEQGKNHIKNIYGKHTLKKADKTINIGDFFPSGTQS
jgi:putative hydrolase of HD superfamily